jgi:hypothetical protein
MAWDPIPNMQITLLLGLEHVPTRFLGECIPNHNVFACVTTTMNFPTH